MRALRLPAWKSDPVLEDVPEPEPGPGQVVIQVGGAGACHSDLHLMHEFEEGLLPWGPPFTLGHENAGWVHATGSGVHGLEPGQPVAVVGAWGCGRCDRCRVGLENYCERPEEQPIPGGGGGLGLDGGMADLMLVASDRLLVGLPEGIDPAHAAPLTDAGLTPYHAVKRSLPKLVADSTAVVIGAGGLGHLAVQVLEALTAATVVVLDPRDVARATAERSGADVTLAPGEESVAEVREIARGRGADVVLDFVGSDETISSGMQMARTMGDFTLVGIAGGSAPYSFFATPYEVSVQTTYWGTRQELVEVLDLAARGYLKPTVETFPLEHAVEVYQRLAAGEVDGRAVIVPHESYSG